MNCKMCCSAGVLHWKNDGDTTQWSEHNTYFYMCSEVQLRPIQVKEHVTPLLHFTTGTLLSKPLFSSTLESKQSVVLLQLTYPTVSQYGRLSIPHSNAITDRQSSDIVQGTPDPKVENSKVSRFMKSGDAIPSLLDDDCSVS